MARPRAQIGQGYADDLFVDHSIDFLKRHQATPFLLYVPLISAHFNIEAPADEIAKHPGKFSESDPAMPLNATYAAQVTRMDAHVGRILATLDELKLREKTLVIFTSDHGATFESGNQGTSNFHDSNRPLRGQKRTLWEGGYSRPGRGLVARKGPRRTHLQRGDRDDRPVSYDSRRRRDPPRTASWHVDGQNVLPTLPASQPWRRGPCSGSGEAKGPNQTAAMRGPFKLVRQRTQRPELFNVVDDPAERRKSRHNTRNSTNNCVPKSRPGCDTNQSVNDDPLVMLA